MTTLERKQRIVNELNTINSDTLLDAVFEMIGNHKDDVYILSEAEQNSIEEAREQIRNGQTIPHEEVLKTRSWLKNK